MTTTPQAALLSDDEIERHFEINKSAPGRELRRLIGRSIEADVLAKLQATQAEPVQAGELPGAPERIWLQINPEGDASDTGYPADHEGVTWCWHSIGGQEVEYVRSARAALSARKPLTCGDLNPDRIFGLADVHADESQEDGRRIFDRDGLVGFAMDAARIGAYPATAPLTKAQIKDLAQDEELLLICDGLDSLEDIVSVIERAHGIGLEVKS